MDVRTAVRDHEPHDDDVEDDSSDTTAQTASRQETNPTPEMFRPGQYGEIKLLLVEACSYSALEALSQVSRDFRGMALLRKYETVVINEENVLLYLNEAKLDQVSGYMSVREKHFFHTKLVVVRVHPRPAKFLFGELELVKMGLAAVVSMIVKQANGPVEIVWDHCFIYDTPINKKLAIRARDATAITGNLYRINWTSLTKLSILNLPLQKNNRAVVILQGTLVAMLLGSPGLKDLGLGVKKTDYANWFKTTARNGRSVLAMRRILGCFQHVVKMYHVKGGRPLHLTALKLGIAFLLLAQNGLDTTMTLDERRAAPKRPANFYLWKLLRGADLQVLHLHTTANTDLGFVDPPPADDPLQGAFAWFCISKEYLPSLVRLVVTERTRRFDEMLFVEGDAEYLQNLQLDPGRQRSFKGHNTYCEPDAEDEDPSTYLHHFSFFKDAYAIPSRDLREKDFNKLQPSHVLLSDVHIRGRDIHKLHECGWLKVVGLKLRPSLLDLYGQQQITPQTERQLLSTIGQAHGITHLWIMNDAGQSRDKRLSSADCEMLHQKIFDAEAVESGLSTTGRMTMANELRYKGQNRAQWIHIGEQRKLRPSQTEAAVRGTKPSERMPQGLFYSNADLWHYVARGIAQAGASCWGSSLKYLKVGSDAWRIHRAQTVDVEDWPVDEEDEDYAFEPNLTMWMEKLALQEQLEEEPELFSHAYDVAVGDEEYRADPKHKKASFEQNEDKIQYGWK